MNTVERLNSAKSTSSAKTLDSSIAGDFEGGGPENIRVVVRVRPLNEREKENGYAEVVTCQEDTHSILVSNGGPKSKSYTFSQTFSGAASQKDVFENCGITGLLDAALDGYAATVFAFGQTGSGKTHTLTGADGLVDGLLPRGIYYLFEKVAQLSSETRRYSLQASYCEIYVEKVLDLLNPTRESLPVRYSDKKGFYVENLFVAYCDVLDDMLGVLEEGIANRQQRGHEINEHSSRSHAIMTVYINIETLDPDTGRSTMSYGKMSFVDLAGSERVKESKATGQGLTEARNINKSLLTLGNCISALYQSAANKTPGKKPHVPYRDSQLTKLLQDSLGGSGYTLMIACVAPYDLEETTKTLRYASRAQRIRNKPVVHMDPKEMLIAALQREVRLLRKENAFLHEQLGGKGTTTSDGTIETITVIPSPSTRSVSSRGSGGSSSRPRSNHLPLLRTSAAAERSAQLLDAEAVIKEYMKENENLKAENLELHSWREAMGRDQQSLMEENDRLRRKLESLEEVFVDNGSTTVKRAARRPSAKESAAPAQPPRRTKVMAGRGGRKADAQPRSRDSARGGSPGSGVPPRPPLSSGRREPSRTEASRTRSARSEGRMDHRAEPPRDMQGSTSYAPAPSSPTVITAPTTNEEDIVRSLPGSGRHPGRPPTGGSIPGDRPSSVATTDTVLTSVDDDIDAAMQANRALRERMKRLTTPDT